MGCLHAKGCPLFPLLNASLRGWRDYYCDSEDRWLDCARYKLSRTGQPVPISLGIVVCYLALALSAGWLFSVLEHRVAMKR